VKLRWTEATVYNDRGQRAGKVHKVGSKWRISASNDGPFPSARYAATVLLYGEHAGEQLGLFKTDGEEDAEDAEAGDD
jgi:hypothetical protein